MANRSESIAGAKMEASSFFVVFVPLISLRALQDMLCYGSTFFATEVDVYVM